MDTNHFHIDGTNATRSTWTDLQRNIPNINPKSKLMDTPYFQYKGKVNMKKPKVYKIQVNYTGKWETVSTTKIVKEAIAEMENCNRMETGFNVRIK
jgi:hypothetical protein